jgi:hypothetical protein
MYGADERAPLAVLIAAAAISAAPPVPHINENDERRLRYSSLGSAWKSFLWDLLSLEIPQRAESTK